MLYKKVYEYIVALLHSNFKELKSKPIMVINKCDLCMCVCMHVENISDSEKLLAT